MHMNDERFTVYFGRNTRKEHNLQYLKQPPKRENINIRQSKGNVDSIYVAYDKVQGRINGGR